MELVNEVFIDASKKMKTFQINESLKNYRHARNQEFKKRKKKKIFTAAEI